jgi:uncharacterized protein (DUF169 family)
MNVSWPGISAGLVEVLGLDAPPIAITFTAGRPDGVATFDAPMPAPLPDGRTGTVPAGCVFWMKGTERTFSTVAEDHGNCSVGSLTHGFVTLDDVAGNSDVGALLDSGWVSGDVVPQIPVVTERPGAVTYGPLHETPFDPDVVMVRLDGAALMLLTDTLPELQLGGKPQCHIVAVAKERQEVALSAGCTLSRARTGIPDDEVTCAIPASQAEAVLAMLRATKAVNDQVTAYALDDAERFAS